jgi:predicted esterase
MVELLRPVVTWISQLAEVPQAEWDALAMPLKTPFLEWEWLNNMETSGSTTARTGWLPNHLTVWRDRHLIAAAPLYLKGHSQGANLSLTISGQIWRAGWALSIILKCWGCRPLRLPKAIAF